MTDSTRSKLRWFRFSLASFLLVAICFGVILAGYRSGYQYGYAGGQATRANETQSTVVYDTLSFTWPDLPPNERAVAVEALITLIRSTVSTDIWEDGTGNEMKVFPTTQSLIVTAPGHTHREIRELLAQLDRLANQGGVEQLLPLLQSLASQGKSQDAPLSITVPPNSQMAQAWLQKYFELTADGVAKRWGTPDFRGVCTESEFPAWSLDQQIATWRRGNGLAYLALRYFDDGQLHIVAGWRNNS